MILNSIIFDENLSTRPLMKDMTMSINETIISQKLQQNGYDTYFIGKWDSGDHYPYTALDRGFNETLTFNLGASRYHRDWSPDIVSLNDRQSVFDTALSMLLPFSISHNNEKYMQPDCYMTDYLSKETVNLIRSRVNNGSNRHAATYADSDGSDNIDGSDDGDGTDNSDGSDGSDGTYDRDTSADPFFLTLGKYVNKIYITYDI